MGVCSYLSDNSGALVTVLSRIKTISFMQLLGWTKTDRVPTSGLRDEFNLNKQNRRI